MEVSPLTWGVTIAGILELLQLADQQQHQRARKRHTEQSGLATRDEGSG
jgi:hypothetical protein